MNFKMLRIYLFIILLVSFFIASCLDKSQKGQITIGEYQFFFPGDYELVEERGIDSYVGKIKGKDLWLGFDYGYYSDNLIDTKNEYLQEGSWKVDAFSAYFKPAGSYSSDTVRNIQFISARPIQNKADSIKFKGADTIAICKLGDSSFEYGIRFPAQTKEHLFLIDTLNGHLRKIVIAKDPAKGATGIYLKDIAHFNESINSYTALSMETSGLTKQQQDSLLKVFLNVKVIEREKE